jgi:cell division protein FtsB
MSHDDDTCPHLVPANRQYHQALSANRKLLAENARLKAEVERLTADNEQLQHRCDFLEGRGL